MCCSRFLVGLHHEWLLAAAKLFLKLPATRLITTSMNWGTAVGEALLQPHLSYLKPLDKLLDTE